MPSRQGDTRRWDLEDPQRFSWLRCFFSIISYLLMLSDVPRAGLGVYDLSFYNQIEPGQFVFFGPYAYPVTKQLPQNARGITDKTSELTSPYWSYKYDTTSVAMRAVARHLHILEWPTCVLYAEPCDERTGIPQSTVFGMIDSLIERVKGHETSGRVGQLTLRTVYEWTDRLHDYAFPWFFSRPLIRTVQATYYNATQLRTSLCSSSSRRRRPLTCGESWTNFGRLCAPANSFCQDVNNIHTHLGTRLSTLLATYPNHTLEFVLLEAVDDLPRSSLTSQGFKNIDVVTLARIRKCTAPTSTNRSVLTQVCDTVVVDDFRYELAPLVTNVREWFWITAILRGIGQGYAWLRLMLLLLGCYAGCSPAIQMQLSSCFGRLKLSVRTMFLLPSPVIVYGSVFPISCYLLAHLIDAPAVYALTNVQFDTIQGVVSLEFGAILRVCAVSMRSLWLLAFVCHIFHRIATHCVWSPIHGVPGVPEFSLSFVASLTILAQVRFPSLRDTRVVYVDEIVPSRSRYHCNSMHSDSSQVFVHKLLFGTLIDYKCLVVSVCVHVGLILAMRFVNHVIPRFFPYPSLLFTRTGVPYSAGTLWPRSALVVSWKSPFLAKQTAPHANLISQSTVSSQSFFNVLAEGFRPLHYNSVHPLQPQPTFRILRSTSEPFTTSLHEDVVRSHEDESLLVLMNLAVMTDPIIFLRLRVLPGPCIGVYTASRAPTRCTTSPTATATTTLLLPLALTTSSSDIPIDWRDLELRKVIRTNELDWCDLLQCG